MLIFHLCVERRISANCGAFGDFTDIINRSNFHIDRRRGFNSSAGYVVRTVDIPAQLKM